MQGPGSPALDIPVRSGEAPPIAVRPALVHDAIVSSKVCRVQRYAVLFEVGRSGNQGSAEFGDRACDTRAIFRLPVPHYKIETLFDQVAEPFADHQFVL